MKSNLIRFAALVLVVAGLSGCAASLSVGPGYYGPVSGSVYVGPAYGPGYGYNRHCGYYGCR